MVKPTTNQTTTHSAVTPRLIELASTSPRAAAVPAPAPTTSTTWLSPMTPMPSTLPAMSCHGRTVASSSSTTRDDFSSTTPCATSWPGGHERDEQQDARRRTPRRSAAPSRSGSGSSAVTSGVGLRDLAADLARVAAQVGDRRRQRLLLRQRREHGRERVGQLRVHHDGQRVGGGDEGVDRCRPSAAPHPRRRTRRPASRSSCPVTVPVATSCSATAAASGMTPTCWVGSDCEPTRLTGRRRAPRRRRARRWSR